MGEIRVPGRIRVEPSQVVVLGLTLVILVLFIVYPLSKVVLSSFVEKGKAITPANLTLANFAEFTSSRLYRGALPQHDGRRAC